MLTATIFQNKELFCYVMFPLSITHVFYGLDYKLQNISVLHDITVLN